DAIILIEAGDLKKGVGLRAIVEAADIAMALPCYADEARDIDTVIDDELRKAGMSMTLEARQALRRNLGGDAASVVAAARPPVFFTRRKLVEKALERWNSEALGRALTRLQTAVLQTRRRPDLSVALARQALLGIAVESARLAQRG
ncbi:MAG: DNA polymerase III subunit delta, partial [Mesorhizobium sp.]